MYPELLGRPVLVRYKNQKPLEGNLIHFDKNKLILLLFDGKTIEIVLQYDALEPHLYSSQGNVDYEKVYEKLCLKDTVAQNDGIGNN